MKVIGLHWRWWVVGMLFIATGLNFLDRQVLSIAIIKIQEEFNISDVQYGWLNTAFLISYGLMFTLGGRLIDLVGGRLGLAFAVGIWSVANAMHGFANNFHQLMGFRFLLGIGEGACFPGAAKSVYEWFDKKERALANGIAIGGAAVGAVVAPPLTIWLTNLYGWRSGFILPGLLGLVWVGIWLLFPKRNPELKLTPTQVKAKPVPFTDLFRMKSTWTFVGIRFLLDPVFYFMMFWIPKYLNEEKLVSFELIGDIFWIPFFALGVSNILGGYLSGLLIQKGLSLDRSRKWIMGLAAILTMVCPLINVVSSVGLGILLMSLLMLAHGFWITNYITAISDMYGEKATSTVVGLSGTAGTLSALMINPLIGLIVSQYSYTPLWIASGILYPIAFLLFILLIPSIKPIFQNN
jgi:MFS transporter, ACS family, hexuronate transporter